MQTYNYLLSTEAVFVIAIFAPAIIFGSIGLGWLAGWQPRERTTSRLTALAFLLSTLAMLLLAWRANVSGSGAIRVSLGEWFAVGQYRFTLLLLADRLSIPLMALTSVLAGLIGTFSSRYLHRDPGFLRFFLLLNLFAFGALLAFAAASLDLLIAGWELVGLTSVLLIAFFHERQEPIRNALRAFATYRLADLGLILGVFLLHHLTGSASCNILFLGDWPTQITSIGSGAATVVGLLFLIAASGKSAQVPFSGWLPRAMEGPTPSSAIFYGAISVHLGVYLLLRARPILAMSPIASAAVIIVGLLTAVHATLSGRVAADAKTSLAYASLAQLGVIFVEVGMGLAWLPVIHVVGHAALRTLQFLRAPSMLHDYHRVHAASGGHLSKTGVHYHAMLSSNARRWLYRFALERGHLDAILDRFVVAPFLQTSSRLGSLDRGNNGEKPPKGLRASNAVTHTPVERITAELAGRIDG